MGTLPLNELLGFAGATWVFGWAFWRFVVRDAPPYTPPKGVRDYYKDRGLWTLPWGILGVSLAAWFVAIIVRVLGIPY